MGRDVVETANHLLDQRNVKGVSVGWYRLKKYLLWLVALVAFSFSPFIYILLTDFHWIGTNDFERSFVSVNLAIVCSALYSLIDSSGVTEGEQRSGMSVSLLLSIGWGFSLVAIFLSVGRFDQVVSGFLLKTFGYGLSVFSVAFISVLFSVRLLWIVFNYQYYLHVLDKCAWIDDSSHQGVERIKQEVGDISQNDLINNEELF